MRRKGVTQVSLSVLAFYNGLTEAAKGYRYLERYGSLLDYLAVFQIAITPDGDLSGRISPRLIDEAHSLGIKVFPVISNLTPRGQFSTPLISRLIREGDFANQVFYNIRDFLARNRFDGVNLDLEHAQAGDRQLYTRFIQGWVRLFQQANFPVTLDVPAKTADEPMAEWKGVFDYRALGRVVDGAVIMTYEEHWPGSEPGSVASLPWVTKVIDYALSEMPASKIFMGIPLYGYDWPSRGAGRAISYPQAMDLARRFGAPLQWDAQQHSTYFNYTLMGERHTVYFEDPRSLREKVNLAKNRNLRGIALWEMNLSYPEFWRTLQTIL